MKSLLKIYLTLAGGVLALTLVLITTFKLTTTSPIAPTVPTKQFAAEAERLGDYLPTPEISNDEVGFIVRIAGLDSWGPEVVLANVSIVSQDKNQTYDATSLALQRGPNGKYFGKLLTPQPSQLFVNTPVTLHIKGEKHLKRRFNDITLSFNQYTDLTNKVLEAGDLPEQDGQVNQSDIDYIKEKIFTDDTKADLNYDGTVNAGDLSLILDTLSVKEDEN